MSPGDTLVWDSKPVIMIIIIIIGERCSGARWGSCMAVLLEWKVL
jgi:hypothetical protein